MIEPSQTGRPEEPRHFLAELRATFAAQAGRPAILYKDASWTYGDLDAKARRCAGRLRQLGVEPGDRVAVLTS
jgi:acyl-CoA synthetase (AMP-forming)/AMP-acid ligase II